MIIFEVNFLLIYKNIDEFGIVCKKKKSVLQENYDHFVWVPFFFFSFFFFFFFSLFFFVFFCSFFFFPLRNVKVGGAAYTAGCGLYAGKYGMQF